MQQRIFPQPCANKNYPATEALPAIQATNHTHRKNYAFEISQRGCMQPSARYCPGVTHAAAVAMPAARPVENAACRL